MQNLDTAHPPAGPAPAFGGRIIVPGLATGHVVFHWILQSSVVALPEIQQAFQLNTVGVGGILSARDLAAGLVAKPAAGFLSDRFGRKQVLVPGLAWSCLAALALTLFDTGIPLTITIALLGLFLYPDQPILVATVFDVVGREVASTGLGIVTCVAFLMSTFSPLIAGALYKTLGFAAAVHYIGALFVAAALVFVSLPLSRSQAEPVAR